MRFYLPRPAGERKPEHESKPAVAAGSSSYVKMPLPDIFSFVCVRYSRRGVFRRKPCPPLAVLGQREPMTEGHLQDFRGHEPTGGKRGAGAIE